MLCLANILYGDRYYASGAPRQYPMQLYRAALLRAGIAEHDIHQEHFQPTTDEKFRRSLVNGHTRVVTLDLLGNRYEFPVPPGSTVLDAALDRGINLPHSCKRGNCASCLATLVNGSVVMANKDALLDFERDRGKVLTCQAQPESDDVHISFS